MPISTMTASLWASCAKSRLEPRGGRRALPIAAELIIALTHAGIRHGRGRVYRVGAGSPLDPQQPARGAQPRQADLCRGARFARRGRGRPALPLCPGRYLRPRLGAAAAGRIPAGRRLLTSPPRAMSTAPSTVPPTSSRPTSSALSRCSRQALDLLERRSPAERQHRFRFHHISTDEVFGSLGAGRPFHRDHALRPALALFGVQGGVGPSGPRVGPHLWAAGAGDQLLEQLRALSLSREADPAGHPPRARRAKPLPVYGDGSNVRDWLFVEDHARALAACSSRASRVKPTTSAAIPSAQYRRRRAICAALDQRQPRADGRSYAELIRSSPTGRAMTGATRSTPRKITRRSAGSPHVTSRQGSRRRSTGICDNRAWWEPILREALRHRRLGVRIGERAT